MSRKLVQLVSTFLLGCLSPVGDADGGKDAGQSPDAALPALSVSTPVMSPILPRVVIARDFDGDGRPDLAVAGAVGASFNAAVAVLANVPDGGFAPLRTHLASSSSAIFVSLVTAGPRLAALDMNSTSITLLDGDGGLEALFAPVSRTGASSLVSADFDGDGQLDFGVLASDEAYVGLAQPDGGFRFGPPLLQDSNAPVHLAAGDFNGDGYADLAVAVFGAGRVLTVLASGDGGFQLARAIPMKISSYAVLAVDVNKDGMLDLVVGNRSTGISVLLGNGDGTFQAPRETPGFGVVALAVSDFDNDGRLEIAAVDYDADRVVITSWNGTALEIRGAHPMADGPRAIAVADFNLDGRPDLAVAGHADGGVALVLEVGR